MATSDSVVPSFYVETIGAPPQERRALSRERFKSVMALSEVSADFLISMVGILAAFFLCTSLRIGGQIRYPVREITAVSIIFGLFVVLLLQRDGAYRGSGGPLQIQETERLVRSPVQSLLLLLLPLSFLLDLNLFHAAFPIAIVLVPLLLIAEKQIFFSIIRTLHLKEYGVDHVVVYGAGDIGRSAVSTLLHAPRLGFYPVAMIENNPALPPGCIFDMGYTRHPIPVQPGPVTSELLKSCQCSLLMIATLNLSSQELAAATHAAKQAGLGIAFLYGPSSQEQQCTKSTYIGGQLLASSIEQVSPWHYAVAKRTVDLVISSLLMVLLTPLFFLIAILIRMDSPGRALFVQKRVGRNGKLFNIYKFRSMHVDAPKYDFSPTTSRDPRITRLGRIIRRMSLDELPQLINVLLGNMSLVGPRPEMPFIVEHYTSQQRRRLQVTPGITGLWQLSPDRAFPIHHNVHYDLYYVRNRTFFMDMAILIHTLFFAMRWGI